MLSAAARAGELPDRWANSPCGAAGMARPHENPAPNSRDTVGRAADRPAPQPAAATGERLGCSDPVNACSGAISKSAHSQSDRRRNQTAASSQQDRLTPVTVRSPELSTLRQASRARPPAPDRRRPPCDSPWSVRSATRRARTSSHERGAPAAMPGRADE